MVVPNKRQFRQHSTHPGGQAILNAWDPAKDEAEGNQCKGYGAGAISRLPTRAHVTWQDDNTLKWESDQGTQPRLFKFGAPAQSVDASLRGVGREFLLRHGNPWQAAAVVELRRPGGARGRARRSGRFSGAPQAATDDAAALLPVNRSPRSCGRARKQSKRMAESRDEQFEVRVICARTEFLQRKGDQSPTTFNRCPRPTVCATWSSRRIIDDPEYLRPGPLITSSNYKKLPDTNNGWDPQPCSVR
jgi:hypothetical protein